MVKSATFLPKTGLFFSNVTVHHEMSRLSPNFDFDVLTFSNSILYALFNGENRF